jgi:Helix-turn-helix domain
MAKKDFETQRRRSSLESIFVRLPDNGIACQRTRLLTAMYELGSVTTFEAMRYLDVFDPRPRIHELRADGHQIVTASRLQQTESGAYHHVGEYLICSGTDQFAPALDASNMTVRKWIQMQFEELA